MYLRDRSIDRAVYVCTHLSIHLLTATLFYPSTHHPVPVSDKPSSVRGIASVRTVLTSVPGRVLFLLKFKYRTWLCPSLSRLSAPGLAPKYPNYPDRRPA